MNRPDASVLIVTYNSAHVIGECLAALDESLQVIVYDNASSDGTAALLREKRPSAQLILGSENLGFAKAVNRAAASATGRNIMLLNPDAVIDAASVKVLVDAVADTHGGIVAPLIDHPPTVKVLSAGHMPTVWRMFTHYFGLSRLSRGRRWMEGHYLVRSARAWEHRFETDWVTGACLMVAAETWHRVGGLDESWFMYAEDIQFCWKVKASGGAVVVAPEATAHHLVGGSSSGGPPAEVNSAWVINLYEFYARDLARTGLQRIAWGVVVGTGLLLRAGVFLAQSKGEPDRQEYRDSARRFFAHSRAVWRMAVGYARRGHSAS